MRRGPRGILFRRETNLIDRSAVSDSYLYQKIAVHNEVVGDVLDGDGDQEKVQDQTSTPR